MTEPTDTQLTQGIENFLADHAEIDEHRFATILAQLVDTHPHRDLIWEAKRFGGQLTTEPLGDLWLIVRYTFGDTTFDVGLIDLRHCVKGPTG